MLQQMTRPERVLLFMKPIIKLPSFKFRPKSCQGKPIRDKKLMKRVSRGRVLQHLYLFYAMPGLLDAGSVVAYKAEEDFRC